MLIFYEFIIATVQMICPANHSYRTMRLTKKVYEQNYKTTDYFTALAKSIVSLKVLCHV